MAFVILPHHASVTRSRVRTFSFRQLVLALSGALVVATGIGFAAGYGLAPRASQSVETTPEISSHAAAQTEAGTRVVIDRIAELSARLVRLESEAQSLGRRVGVLRDFEARRAGGDARAEGRAPRAELGRPTAGGGPLIPPLGGGLPEPVGSLSPGRALSPEAGIDWLDSELARVDRTLAAIDDAAGDQQLRLMAYPSRAPLLGGDITSSFGNRLDPIRNRLAFHSGVDYPAPPGTPILASGGGKVVFAGWQTEYGHTVEIDHGDGLVTRYAHASRLFVREGAVVVPGQHIAAVGSTGRSTGPHLHFEVLRNGEYANPRRYLADAR